MNVKNHIWESSTLYWEPIISHMPNEWSVRLIKRSEVHVKALKGILSHSQRHGAFDDKATNIRPSNIPSIITLLGMKPFKNGCSKSSRQKSTSVILISISQNSDPLSPYYCRHPTTTAKCDGWSRVVVGRRSDYIMLLVFIERGSGSNLRRDSCTTCRVAGGYFSRPMNVWGSKSWSLFGIWSFAELLRALDGTVLDAGNAISTYRNLGFGGRLSGIPSISIS
jgi:hypothetical protein